MSKAYLVVDMSNDFVDDNGSLTAGKPAQQIVDAILSTCEKYRSEGDTVVFCMDAHEEGCKHFEMWPPHNVIGSWGQQLYGDLKDWYDLHKEEDNVIFLPKGEYDAFYQTELGDILRARHVTDVRVSGVCTDICVFNTVYGAYKEGFPTTVASNECATFTGNHRVFLDQMNAIYKTTVL